MQKTNEVNDDENTQIEVDTYAEEQSGRFRRSGIFFLKVSFFFVVLFALFMFGLSLMLSISVDAIENIQNKMDQINSWLMFVRWLMITVVITYWIEINTWLAKHKSWSKAHLNRVVNGRWSALGVFVFIEAIFIQRIHEPVITFFINLFS